jgi:hypothetical protein
MVDMDIILILSGKWASVYDRDCYIIIQTIMSRKERRRTMHDRKQTNNTFNIVATKSMEVASRLAVYAIVMVLFDLLIDLVVIRCHPWSVFMLSAIVALLDDGWPVLLAIGIEVVRRNRSHRWGAIVWEGWIHPSYLSMLKVGAYGISIMSWNWIAPFLGCTVLIHPVEALALAWCLQMARGIHNIVVLAMDYPTDSGGSTDDGSGDANR